MKADEILRIVQRSVPKLLSVTCVDNKKSVEEKDATTGLTTNGAAVVPSSVIGDEHNYSEYVITNLHTQTVCNLWAGMGHIYKVSFSIQKQQNDDHEYSEDDVSSQTTTLINPSNAVARAVSSSSNKKVASKKLNRKATSSSSTTQTLIIKHIVLPKIQQQQQRDNEDDANVGDRRKIDSYYVEANFYEKLAPMLRTVYNVTIPSPYIIERSKDDNNNLKQQKEHSSKRRNAICKETRKNNEIIISMSYVENDRQLLRHTNRLDQRNAVLSWLANFHAIFWGSERADVAVQMYGLQKEGSYWYYNTRQYEHQQMTSDGWIGRLKYAACAISDYLQHRDIYQCIIHGDAKEANILYTSTTNGSSTSDKDNVLATFCDFQYCGKGAFTKDLAYYLMRFDSYKTETDDLQLDDALTFYLDQLSKNLSSSRILKNTSKGTVEPAAPTLSDIQTSFLMAYCDLYRFMIGWGYWGSLSPPKNPLVMKVLDQLDNGTNLLSNHAYDEALHREFG